MFKKSIYIVLVASMLNMSCATNIAKKIEVPPTLNLTRTEEYTKDTVQLKEELLKAATQIQTNVKYGSLVNGKLEMVADATKANYVLLSPDDFDKVVDLIQLTSGSLDIIKSQTSLINTYIKEINDTKALAEIERAKNIIAMSNWQNSEELFNQEHKIRMREKLFNKLEIIGITIGGIAMVAVGL